MLAGVLVYSGLFHKQVPGLTIMKRSFFGFFLHNAPNLHPPASVRLPKPCKHASALGSFYRQARMIHSYICMQVPPPRPPGTNSRRTPPGPLPSSCQDGLIVLNLAPSLRLSQALVEPGRYRNGRDSPGSRRRTLPPHRRQRLSYVLDIVKRVLSLSPWSPRGQSH